MGLLSKEQLRQFIKENDFHSPEDIPTGDTFRGYTETVSSLESVSKSLHKTIDTPHKIGQGISPHEFMEGMQIRTMELSNITNTKNLFIANYEHFTWTDEDNQQFFTDLGKHSDLHCLILCTDWCPDVIWNVPVLFQVMEQSSISTEVLLMEEHLETMDFFLTDGGRAQPIAVLLNANGDVLFRWGARPAYIQTVMERFKKNHPDKQAGDYQENLNHVYQEIGELYHAGSKYKDVILQELRELFTTFHQ